MAVKDIVARGIGFTPGSVAFIVTHGLSVGELWSAVPKVSSTWSEKAQASTAWSDVNKTSTTWGSA